VSQDDSSAFGTSTKSDLLVAHLLRLVATASSGARLPSVRALMTRFGISQSTVTSALDRLESQGVLTRRQGSGVFVASALATRPILILVESDTAQSPSSFWEILIHGLRQRYADHPAGLEIQFTKSGSPTAAVESRIGRGLIEDLRAHRYAGVYAICQSDAVLNLLFDLGICNVGYSCAAKYHVHMAPLEVCQLGVAALAKVGCRQVALYDARDLAARETFVATVRAYGLNECVVSHLDPWADATNYATITRGFIAALSTFGTQTKHANHPDGVVILDDMFAQGFLMGLNRLGIRAGTDVQVASHANAESPTLLGWTDRIIRMEFVVEEVIATMHSALESLIRKEEPSDQWENATWLNAENGPFRVAFVHPRLVYPTT